MACSGTALAFSSRSSSSNGGGVSGSASDSSSRSARSNINGVINSPTFPT
jgi:hypothetical protein